ncbi:MAG: hypothetical protein EXR91_03250 [Gemmatimonadetes bacterium]|nr:hypothetical protein [Gemmatimonadota bacterium]
MRVLSSALALCTLVGVSEPAALIAQEPVTLIGLVRDSADRPLAEVLVFVDDGSAAILTDAFGAFRLEGVAPDARAVSYRKSGYVPRSFSLGTTVARTTLDLGVVALQPGPDPIATLLGTVTERIGGQPLAGATIELNGETLSVTDSLGAFEVPSAAVRWGPNTVIVRHRSFAETTAGDAFWVTNSGTILDFSVALDVAPLGLPGVDVPVGSPVLEATGFYERREEGNGVFMTQEEIIAKDARRTEDLFWGMGLLTNPLNRAASTFGLADDGEPCTPLLFLDGLRVDRLSMRDLNQILGPEDIEGLEIYETVGSLPARFSPVGAACGVIIIWTH